MIAIEASEIWDGPAKHYLAIEIGQVKNGSFTISPEQYMKQIIEENDLSLSKDSSVALNPEHMKSCIVEEP